MAESSNQVVRFINQPVLNKAAGEKAGHPIFDTIPHIEIRKKSTPRYVQVSRATDQHKAAYPREWALFEQTQQTAESGMPIEEWAQITAGAVETCKRANIMTVEQLAALPKKDAETLRVGDFKTKAKAFLDTAEKVGQTAEELNALRNKTAEQEAEIGELKAQLRAANEELRELTEPAKASKAA